VAHEVVSFARHTTDSDPLLPIPAADTWHYLNAVLNEVTECFAAGQIKRDLGQPVTSGLYLLALTCERAGTVRTQKVRGILVRKSLLTALPEQEPQYEQPQHATRWRTLQQMAALYSKTPGRFIELEICV